jgi:hypothetical protein
MIQFRCWYCNKRYAKRDDQVGQQFTCSCQSPLRVPRVSGGNCKVKTLADWGIEAVVYGGGGALLGLGLAVLILSRVRIGDRVVGGASFHTAAAILVGLTLVGFLAGLFGGEPGINWLGQWIRNRENR